MIHFYKGKAVMKLHLYARKIIKYTTKIKAPYKCIYSEQHCFSFCKIVTNNPANKILSSL